MIDFDLRAARYMHACRTLASGSKGLEQTSSEYIPKSSQGGMVGGGGIQTYTFKASGEGENTLQFVYKVRLERESDSERASERARERERERLLGTKMHKGGSRSSPAECVCACESAEVN